MMKNIKTLGTRCACALVFATIMLAATQLIAKPQASEYLQDDGKIYGNQINSFSDKGKRVAVVRGGFRFTVASRTVSGDNAVIWISTHGKTQHARHDVTIYVSGNARVEDIESSTTDSMMLVRLHLQGKISAHGSVSQTPLLNSRLYRQAVETLKEEQRMLKAIEARAARRGKPLKEDPLVVRKSATKAELKKAASASEAKKDAAVPTRLADVKPTSKAQPADAGAMQVTEEVVKIPEAPKAKKTKADPKEAMLISAVNFDAADGVEMQRDPQDKNKRIIVSKGPIYISQGPAKSLNHVELRAQAAVVFTQKGVVGAAQDEKVPYAPELIGPGVNQGEKVTGVYLEGDVIIARGERKIMGKAAYYDFVNRKAMILKPVLRTIQEQRNIPIYIRADEAHVLGPKETEFRNAIVSTSDFSTPSYSLNSSRVRFRDETEYDDDGSKLSENKYSATYDTGSMQVRGVPIFLLPPGKTEFEQGHTALRNISIGQEGDLGVGVESEWHLFRLLGIVKPHWFDATLTASAYKEAVIVGSDFDYQKQEGNRNFSGYGKIYGVIDQRSVDSFGRDNEDVIPRKERGRILARHKEFLPRDWEIQAELSLISDRNYMREFFEDEYYGGKQQESLIYAKKQRDNWAISGLVKANLNYFETQTESLPELSAYLIGEPLLNDTLTFFSETHAGVKRLDYNASETLSGVSSALDNVNLRIKGKTNTYFKFDTRNEISLPFQIDTKAGPINIAPFVVARLTAWGSQSSDGKIGVSSRDLGTQWIYRGPMGDPGSKVRPFGAAGVRANMNFWRVYNGVQSRLFDINRLRHIITPEVVFYSATTGGVNPEDVYPLDWETRNNDIQQRTGAKLAVFQRLQTKRGAPGNERTVDWMRLNVEAGIFDGSNNDVQDFIYPADGRFFFDRPENSITRNYIAADYTWNISDRTVFMADAKYDCERSELDILNLGLAVQRDPRLTYFLGFRYMEQLDSAVGTIGFDYQISKKYMLKVFEQYDFKYKDGKNLGTSVMIVRRLPRWNVGVNFTYDAREEGNDALTMMLMLWPEGVPEARLGGGRYNLLGESSEN